MEEKKYSLSVCDMTFTSDEELNINEWHQIPFNQFYDKVHEFLIEFTGKHLDKDIVFSITHTDEFFMTPKAVSMLRYIESNKDFFSQSEYEFVDRDEGKCWLDVHLNYESAMKLELDRREVYPNCYEENK